MAALEAIHSLEQCWPINNFMATWAISKLRVLPQIYLFRDLLLERIHANPTGPLYGFDAVVIFPVLRVENLGGPLVGHFHLQCLLL